MACEHAHTNDHVWPVDMNIHTNETLPNAVSLRQATELYVTAGQSRRSGCRMSQESLYDCHSF